MTMDTSLASADLDAAFQHERRLCKVREGETVLIFTDPRFVRPAYPPAAFAAARALGANAYILTSQGDQKLDDPLVRAAWKNADMILGMSMLPRGIGSWMYTDTHNDALKAGARVLMVQEPLDGLLRMLPNETVRRRGLAGAQLLQEAKEIHVVSKAGSDYVMRKDGRKAMYQCGIADEPGRWDHWPSGLVTCAPIEDSAEGTYVVEPGDVLLGLWRFATTRVELTLEKGRIVKIAGGSDAYLLQSYLDSVGDDGAYRFSHAGWGTDERADWGHIGMDSESKYGTILVAIGRNMFDAPAPYSGMAGKNESGAHCDICCRNTSLYLDGKLIVENEKFLVPELV
jgi:2,5-dihydroxypyridine 5,6-dioxygenase